MNKVLFERVCELEAKLELEIKKRWQAEQQVINVEKELHRLRYLMSKQESDETTVG